jgi:hypothetical protein
MVAALGAFTPAAHAANARSHRVNISQSLIQIAVNQVWAPVFAFVWGSGNVVVISNPVSQVNNQSGAQVVTIGGN